MMNSPQKPACNNKGSTYQTPENYFKTISFHLLISKPLKGYNVNAKNCIAYIDLVRV